MKLYDAIAEPIIETIAAPSWQPVVLVAAVIVATLAVLLILRKRRK